MSNLNTPTKDPRRAFNKKERLAVELVTGQTGAHADHIIPHSKGGPTSVENCQLLDAKTNQRKGNFLFKPREWQTMFLEAWDDRVEGDPFMLVVIPGGGKTMATLEACRRWMQDAGGKTRRIVVVVPSDNLREQWRTEATRFGINLQTKEFGINFKDEYHGGVTTYQALSIPEGHTSTCLRKFCQINEILVVFDEIHHCAEKATFGEGVLTTFAGANEYLLLSGTPWKTDGRSIPYVTYNKPGYVIPNYNYDYPQGLLDNVVRYLVFNYSTGIIKNDLTAEIEEITQGITDEEAQQRLNKLLDPDGAYVRKQIQITHQKLIECRQRMPDAAALVICKDQRHAERIGQIIEEITRSTPSVIVTDSDKTNATVKEFRNGSAEWLVSVRKVAEGTDIKRLQVLCYLTNVMSELFFRQVIGRVSRVRNMGDYEAYVFFPAVPKLIRFAENIEEAQVKALEEEEGPPRPPGPEGPPGPPRPDLFESYSTDLLPSEAILAGKTHIPAEYADHIMALSQKHGIPLQKAMGFYFDLGEVHSVHSVESAPTSTSTAFADSKEEREESLRGKCHKKALELHFASEEPIWSIHRRFKPQKTLSEKELVHKLEWLMKEIQKWKAIKGNEI
jgi:superfamily II DNA or RNA helicase